MKHLKTFENSDTSQYNVGDYIMILTKKIERHIDSDYENSYEAYKRIRIYLYTINNDYKNNMGKIIEINNKYPTPYYNVEFFNGRSWNVRENEIKRKLTPKEIEKYETQITQNKYNI
jgi:hypothetical protein